MEGRLKNFNIYFNKLLDYAKICDIKIFFKKNEDNYGSIYNRNIYLDDGMTEKEILSYLLHELGHFIHEQTDPERYQHKEVVKAYEIMFKKEKVPFPLNLVIFEIEEIACKNGQVLAKQLKIPTGKWYSKNMEKLLNTYRGI